MRTDTKIKRAAEAPALARARAGVGMPGAARKILKEARDLARQARDELATQLRELQAAEVAITSALSDLDERR